MWRLASATSPVVEPPVTDLASARLGCIDPHALAELLQLSPEQRAQLLQALHSTPQALRPDGTVPIEVGLGISTRLRAAG
nr:hypothetical protein [Synechococcus sp. HK05]